MVRRSVSPPFRENRFEKILHCVNQPNYFKSTPNGSNFASIHHNNFMKKGPHKKWGGDFGRENFEETKEEEETRFWNFPGRSFLLPKNFLKTLEIMLSQEKMYAADFDYLERVQKEEVKDFMRKKVVDWMYEICRKLKLSSETFSFSVNYFDRFLSKIRVKLNHLEIISIACILIASKFHEESFCFPSLNSLVKISNSSFSVCDLQRMEKLILAKLSWKFHVITSHSFLSYFQHFLVLPFSCS
eukprot:Sdes_comp24024_c0_seq1m22102